MSLGKWVCQWGNVHFQGGRYVQGWGRLYLRVWVCSGSEYAPPSPTPYMNLRGELGKYPPATDTYWWPPHVRLASIVVYLLLLVIIMQCEVKNKIGNRTDLLQFNSISLIESEELVESIVHTPNQDLDQVMSYFHRWWLDLSCLVTEWKKYPQIFLSHKIFSTIPFEIWFPQYNTKHH